MVNLVFETEIVLNIYNEQQHATLKIQDNLISTYFFVDYIDYPEDSEVSFLVEDGSAGATVKYDVLRIW